MTPTEEANLKARATHLLQNTRWVYADKDPQALADLKHLVDDFASRKRRVSYSNLVHKVDFHLPNVNGGATYRIDVNKWMPSDGAIIGEFLSYLSMQSIIQDNYLLSALVVNVDTQKPGAGFYDLARQLGLLAATGSVVEKRFWEAEKGYIFAPSTVMQRVIPFT